MNSTISSKHNQTPNSSLLFTTALLLIVAMIISFFCLFTYSRIHRRLETIAVAESEQAISLSSDIISASFRDVWEVFTDPLLAYDFSETINNELQNDRLPHGCLLSLSTLLDRHFYTHDYINDIALFITVGTTDYWCTKDFISADFRQHYESGRYSFNGLSYDEFRDMLLNSSDNRLVRQSFYSGALLSDSYSGHIIYLMYPVRTYRDNLSVFAIMQIDLDSIRETLTSSQYCGTDFTFFSSDRPVYSTAPTADLSGTDPYYIKNVISELGLTCYISLDSDKIFEGISPFSNLLIVMFSITFSLFALFILFLFRCWLVPISQMANALPSVEDAEKPIAKITRYLNELRAQNTSIQQDLFHHQTNQQLRAAYLGHDSSVRNINTVSELAPAHDMNFRCIYISHILSADPQQINLKQIMEQIKESPIPSIAHAVIDEVVTCLVLQDEHPVYSCSHTIYDSLNALLADFNDDCSQFAIGISDVYSGVSSIHHAYQQARLSWQSALAWQNSAVVFNTTLTQASGSYLVSYPLLESLYQAIISNHKDTALKIFDKLASDNFGNNTPRKSALYRQQFIDDIMGVLIRISTEHDIYALIESYRSQDMRNGFKNKIELLRNTLSEVCDFIPIHNYDNELINALLTYCDEHYNDYQLSLSQLADQFNLSTSSISKYFKANSGINFSTYIERLRLSHAKELILEGNMSMQKIAEEVGYQNSRTFYTAFRKNENCSPTEWKQKKTVSAVNEQ